MAVVSCSDLTSKIIVELVCTPPGLPGPTTSHNPSDLQEMSLFFLVISALLDGVMGGIVDLKEAQQDTYYPYPFRVGAQPSGTTAGGKTYTGLNF